MPTNYLQKIKAETIIFTNEIIFFSVLFVIKIQIKKRANIEEPPNRQQIPFLIFHYNHKKSRERMPELKPIPEGTIRCPYMPEHVMHKQSLVTHLNRCKATNKHLFKVCMYNSLHIIPRQLYDEHIQNCQDSNQLDQSYREVVFNNQRERENDEEERDWIGRSWQNARFQDDSHSSGGDDWLSESSCSENNGYGYYQYCQYDPYYQTARQYRQNEPKSQGIDCNFEEGGHGHGHKLDPRKYNLTPRNQWQKPYLPYPSRNNKNSQSFGANHQRKGYMNTESEKYFNYHYDDNIQNQNQRRKFSDQNFSNYPEIQHNYPKDKIQPQKLWQQQQQNQQRQQHEYQYQQQQRQQQRQQQQQQKQQYPNFRKKGEVDTQKIQTYNGQSDKDTHQESVQSLSIRNKNIGNDKKMRMKMNVNNKSWNDDDGDDDDDNKEKSLQQQLSNVDLNKSMNVGDDAQILFFIHEIDSKMQKINIQEESFDEFGDVLAEQASFIKNKRNTSNLRRMPDELFNQ